MNGADSMSDPYNDKGENTVEGLAEMSMIELLQEFKEEWEHFHAHLDHPITMRRSLKRLDEIMFEMNRRVKELH